MGPDGNGTNYHGDAGQRRANPIAIQGLVGAEGGMVNFPVGSGGPSLTLSSMSGGWNMTRHPTTVMISPMVGIPIEDLRKLSKEIKGSSSGEVRLIGMSSVPKRLKEKAGGLGC